MTAAKRALIKLAIIGTLTSGAIAMPMVASAAPNEHSCHGLWMGGGKGSDTGQVWNPALHAAAFGGTPADLSEYTFDVYCAGLYPN
jgi:hypothetical protein